MRRFSLLAALLLAACGPQAAETAPAGLLLDNARVIVGDGSIIEQGGVLIRDGQIVEVRDRPSPESADVQRVDLVGTTILPALIDGHVHLGYEGYTGWGGENYGRESVENHLRHLAWYGFGAALTTGTDDEALMTELIREQRAGRVARARVFFAAGVAPPDAGPNPQMLEATRSLSGEVVHPVDSPASARALVGRLDALPSDLIKVWVDDRGGSQPKLQPGVYRALIQAADSAGMRVIAHQQTVDDMMELLDAGAAGFLHGRFGPDFGLEEARAVSRADAFIVPNLGLGERGRTRDWEDPFLAQTLRPETLERLEAEFRPREAATAEDEAALRGTMAALIDARADVILGTDAGALPDHFFGYAGHRELWRFVELGMTPMQALMAATSVAARQLGIDDAGVVAPGMRADLLILERNPLDDIRNTQSIRSVYLAGEALDRESLGADFRGAETER